MREVMIDHLPVRSRRFAHHWRSTDGRECKTAVRSGNLEAGEICAPRIGDGGAFLKILRYTVVSLSRRVLRVADRR